MPESFASFVPEGFLAKTDVAGGVGVDPASRGVAS